METSWVIIAAIAYLVMALSQLIDKAFLQVVFKEANAYVFLVGALGGLAIVLLPFGITLLPPQTLMLAIIGGALFIGALIPFLSALQGDDASRVIPLIGAVVPLATLVGEWLALGATFEKKDLLAFAFLVAGAVILTFTRSESPRRSRLAAIKAIIGSLLFAASFVITKYIFNQTDFINGFFWMRMGGVIVALLLLFNHSVRNDLAKFFKKTKTITKVGYFANQGLAGSGFVLQNIAISIASVSLVNALQGIQYVFIIIFVGIAAKFNPDLLGEKITRSIVLEKLTAIVVIIAGIALLSL